MKSVFCLTSSCTWWKSTWGTALKWLLNSNQIYTEKLDQEDPEDKKYDVGEK